MATQEERMQEHLKSILDRLGPGLALKVEDFLLVIAFGREDMVKKVEQFAHENRCAFRYNGFDKGGWFGRAYFDKSMS